MAVSDIERIEQALDTSKLTLELYHTEASLPHELRFKVFSPNAYVAPSVVLPILEAGGLQAGRDFFLAYSPEREDPGNPHYSAARIPKVVGGLDAQSLELAQRLYGHAVRWR